MLTHSRKIRDGVFLAVASLVCSSALLAQQDTSTSAPPTPAPPIPLNSASTPQGPGQPVPQASAVNADSSTSSSLDYLFNHKPQEGSVAKEGMDANQQAKTDALAQNALGNQQIQDPDVRSQFEAYLAMNEVPQDQLTSYATDMQTVIDLLHQRRTTQAWQKLYQLAKYQSIVHLERGSN